MTTCPNLESISVVVSWFADSLDIKNELTYLKCGSWVNELGGLNSPKTNQRFIEVKTQKVLNELFDCKYKHLLFLFRC